MSGCATAMMQNISILLFSALFHYSPLWVQGKLIIIVYWQMQFQFIGVTSLCMATQRIRSMRIPFDIVLQFVSLLQTITVNMSQNPVYNCVYMALHILKISCVCQINWQLKSRGEFKQNLKFLSHILGDTAIVVNIQIVKILLKHEKNLQLYQPGEIK